MTKYLKTFACLLIAGVALSAHADTTYTATGILAGTNTSVAKGPDGKSTVTDVTGTLSGTANISDAGIIDSFDLVVSLDDGLTVNINPSDYVSAFGTTISGGEVPGLSTSGVYLPVPGLPLEDADLFFFYIVTPLSGPYDGGAICTAALCGGFTVLYTPSFDTGFDGAYYLTSGELVGPQVASTPEPSSLALLGTGLLGAVGMARRRFPRA